VQQRQRQLPGETQENAGERQDFGILAPSHKKALEIAPSAAALADARALIDRADVEAVVVATPSHRHREIAVAALAAGKHVYCEAPLAASLDDARAIAGAAKGSRCVFQGGLQGRANSLYRHVGQFVKSGVLGTPVMASVHWARKVLWPTGAALVAISLASPMVSHTSLSSPPTPARRTPP